GHMGGSVPWLRRMDRHPPTQPLWTAGGFFRDGHAPRVVVRLLARDAGDPWGLPAPRREARMRGAATDIPVDDLRIDICVCTYRRPELEDTLLSLGGLNVPAGATVRIIVADNDAAPSAR